MPCLLSDFASLSPPSFLGFPWDSAGKESARIAADLGWIPGSGRSPGERKGYLLQYSGLENSMDCKVCQVAKSQTQLCDFPFQFPSFSADHTWGRTMRTLLQFKTLQGSLSFLLGCRCDSGSSPSFLISSLKGFASLGWDPCLCDFARSFSLLKTGFSCFSPLPLIL